MSTQQPRITLHPPPHRSYLAGYGGIPPSSPNGSGPSPPLDPLLNLPILLRPAATLSGTVEVKVPQKASGKARWLRVELEKIESVPSSTGGEGGKASVTYVEHIGSKPETLWEAGGGRGSLMKSAEGEGDAPSSKGGGEKKTSRFVSLVKKSNTAAAEEEDEEGWESIPEGSYAFSLPLPEGLPPTTEVDSKSNGISYQLVATLCSRSSKSKGLLRTTQGKGKMTNYTSHASIMLLKADMLPTWPIYSPLLGAPLPLGLPWENPSGPTTGEMKEVRMRVGEGEGGGEVWMKVIREAGALGPGDECRVRVIVGWEGGDSLKLTRIDFVLREILSFKTPLSGPASSGRTQKGTPRITSIFSSNANVSSDPKDDTAFAILYPHEPVSFDLSGTVPTAHSRVTVSTAKYIEVSYHLKIRAMLSGGGTELAVDHWPIILGHVGRRESNGLLAQIGYVEGLCARPGKDALEDSEQSAMTPTPRGILRMANSPDLPASVPLRQPSSPPLQNGAFTPRFAHLDTARTVAPSTQLPPRQDSFAEHHTPQRLLGTGRYPRFHPSADPSSTPSPAPRPTFSPSPTAAEEKHRLHHEAVLKREEAQAQRLVNEEERAKHEEALRRRQAESLSSPISPTSDAFTSDRSSISQYTQHEIQSAAVVRRQLVQDGLTKPPHLRSDAERAALDSLLTSDGALNVAQGHLAPIGRSNTTMARSGSSVGGGGGGGDDDGRASPTPSPTPVATPPSHSVPLHPLVRSKTILTGAEAEKRRLYEEARARAVQRQEEARIEMDRQAAFLASLEAEEVARAEAEYELEMAATREEERRRAQALAARDEFERQERERALRYEQEWRREEEERQRQARAEFEERMRQQEARRVDELRRLAEQQREYEEESKAEMLKRRMERDRAEEARRAEVERLRIEREEQEEAARRAIEQQRQEEEEAHRRQLEENKRRAFEARIAEEEEERRWKAEQARLAAEEHARREMEERHCEEQEQERRQQEEQQQRAALASSQRSYHPHQLYDAPVPRDPSSFVRPDTQQSPPPGLDVRGHPQPQGYGQYQAPHHYSGGPASGPFEQRGYETARVPLARSNSFAPGTSANEADVNFYAKAIANSASPSAQDSALSEEKAAYIRRLREATLSSSQHDHQSSFYQPQTHAVASAPLDYGRPPPHEQSPYYSRTPQSTQGHASAPPQDQYHLGSAPSHAYPQPSVGASPVESSTAQPWSEHINPPSSDQQQQWTATPRHVSLSAVGGVPAIAETRLPHLSSSTSTTPTPATFRTAKVEKDEEEARRMVAERARLAPSNLDHASAPEEDSLPSYPLGSSSSPMPQTAAEEKGALNAYFAAKAAVEAQQQAARAPPPLPLSRSGFTTSQPTPLHPIQEAHQNGYPRNDPASPPQISRPPRRDSGSEASSEVYRDPAITAGKRPVHVSRSVSGTTIPETGSASPPPPLPPQPRFYEASAPQ